MYRAGKVNCASRIYATVEFRNPVIVRRALKVNGTEIKGMKLTVCPYSAYVDATSDPSPGGNRRWRRMSSNCLNFLIRLRSTVSNRKRLPNRRVS